MVVVIAGGCIARSGDGPDEDPQRAAGELVSQLGLTDAGGDVPAAVHEQELKLERSYYTVQGRIEADDREDAVAQLTDRLARSGWDIRSSEVVDLSLGHRIRALRRGLVVEVFTGPGSPDLPGFPPEEGRMWVALRVAVIGSGPAWATADT
ncbi:MAG TPA: hypothetical protein VG452_06225 [Egibacteraceae bacterium]|nr:hypothetical protein [Egibacteraceae bacterium]